jgi:hypothetical protein
MLCIEPGLNMLYQRADIRASGSKFIEAEIIVISKFIASIIEDHAAVQHMECSCMLQEEQIEQVAGEAENRRLTLSTMFDMSLLNAASFCTFSNKSAFDKVSPLTFVMSLAFEDVSMLTFDFSSSFNNLSAWISLACPFILPSNSCQK